VLFHACLYLLFLGLIRAGCKVTTGDQKRAITGRYDGRGGDR
jgi:hypothetical protein